MRMADHQHAVGRGAGGRTQTTAELAPNFGRKPFSARGVFFHRDWHQSRER